MAELIPLLAPLVLGILIIQYIVGLMVGHLRILAKARSGKKDTDQNDNDDAVNPDYKIFKRIIGVVENVIFSFAFFFLTKSSDGKLDENDSLFLFAIIAGWFAVKTLSRPPTKESSESADNPVVERYIFIIGTLTNIALSLLLGYLLIQLDA